MVKMFTPKKSSMSSTRMPKVKLSSHMVRPARMSMGKLSIKAPSIGSKRSVGKVTI